MNSRRISKALKDISSEKDPALKMLKLASLCSAVGRQRGFKLVVVGGSAIELLTEGAYVSGDLDLCLSHPARISSRLRQEFMGDLGGIGGPRSWQTAGMFVDLLGSFETLARTPLRRIHGPYGLVEVAQPEELLVERVLVSVYPRPYPPSWACAKKLAAVALKGALEMDWKELRRLAARPEYRILDECRELLREVADEVETKSPLDPA